MFYSQCLLSRKGPLGVIWVAAYCHKRLKKTQVAETDISSSVEKILLDDFPKVACRVLGYLLLGVVRIYSKKVGYLFDDCQEVLTKVNDFKGTKIINTPAEASCPPLITITLPERFELDAFDVENFEDVSGCHVRPNKDIMLEDAWKNETSGRYSLEKYLLEEDVSETFAAAGTPPECVHSPLAGSLLTKLRESGISLEKLRDERFSREECMDREMFFGVMENPSDFNRPLNEEHHSDGEQMNFQATTSSEHGSHQFIIEAQLDVFSSHLMDDNVVGSPPPDLSVEETMKKLQENRLSQVEHPGHEKADEEPPGLVTCEDPADVIKEHPGSMEPKATPELNFPDASVAAAPDLMDIPTPAKKESARVLRKRKYLFDEVIVLPNKVVRESIDNSRDLICKRRKVPHTALDAWKASQIPILTRDFMEPLLPYSSLKIRSLFSRKQFKATEPVETVESVQALPTVGRSSELTVLPSKTLVDPATSFPTLGTSMDRSAIAPETPVECSTSRSRKGLKDSDRWGSMSSFESIDRELSPTEEQDLDLNLLNEDIYSCEGDPCDGDRWSVRTRAVAEYLHRSFLNRRKQGDKEVVSLFKVLKRKSRKEGARLFYEILVLKTQGYVDVMQNESYSDISVCSYEGSTAAGPSVINE